MDTWQRRAAVRAARAWLVGEPHTAVTILQRAGFTDSEVHTFIRTWQRRASEAFRQQLVESIRASRPDRKTHRARQSKRTAKRT